MLALFAAAALAAPVRGVPAAVVPIAPPPIAQSPQLRITLNGGEYNPGDRVRVQVESAEDGFLIVFRVDGDGRVRVLFPIDPDLDPFVRGGKRYELRGRGERETFLADDRSGDGLVYAALSGEPFNFRGFASGDHWDYNAVRLSAWDADAEAELTQLVKRMTFDGRFGYDVLSYRVRGGAYISGGAGIAQLPGNYGYRDPFWDPYWSCLACGYGTRHSGVNINIGIRTGWDRYDPWGRYDPWNWDPFGYGYGGYGYGYGGYGGYGYGYGGYGSGYGGYQDPWNARYPGQYRPITVINLPRPQVPNTPYGLRTRPRPVPPSGALVPDLTRAMRPGEPGRDNGRVVPDDRSRGRSVEPTRSTRPSESQRPERRSNPPSAPPSARPTSSPPASSGGSTSSDRSRRRPNESAAIPTEVVAPQMDRRGAERPMVDPAVRRGEEPQPVFRRPAGSEPFPPDRTTGRSAEPQPVFREPFRARPEERNTGRSAEPQRSEPSRSQPVYREPPRSEPQRAEPQRSEPQRAEPQRSERPYSMPSPRSEPSARSAPPPSSPPSSPPASPPASNSGRARKP